MIERDIQNRIDIHGKIQKELLEYKSVAAFLFLIPQGRELELSYHGTSEHVQGVEVPFSYSGEIPEGRELIELAAGLLMVFNGQEYDDEYFMDEVNAVWEAIEKYNPKTYGYEWDTTQPRFQLEPRGERGYIEARPVKRIK